jgi:LytS/YehU family sensor histidine kinase
MAKDCETQVKPRTIREFFSSSYFWKPFTGIMIGAAGGFLYYYFIGCTSGSCAITSSPYMSTLMGGLLGFFLVNSPCSKRCG